MTRTEALDDNYLGITAIITVSMQLFFFFIAYTFQFDKVTDLAGSMNFVVLAFITFFLGGTYHDRQIINTLLVLIWGFRLGSFLLYRVLKRGKDERFDEMRSKFLDFLGFWVFQMLWVWIVSLPLTFLNAAHKDVPIGSLDVIGWIFWSSGFILQVTADYSKDKFANDPNNKGKLLSTGVWGITRHPNYAGEIFMWTGLFLSSASVFSENDKAGFVSILSPLFTFSILMFLSGVNLAEERYDKRFGADPEYIEYKRTTAPLIPFPSSLYGSLPDTIKLLLCCEFPMYSRHLNNLMHENDQE